MKSLKEERAERAVVAGVRKDPWWAKENGRTLNHVNTAHPTGKHKADPGVRVWARERTWRVDLRHTRADTGGWWRQNGRGGEGQLRIRSRRVF